MLLVLLVLLVLTRKVTRKVTNVGRAESDECVVSRREGLYNIESLEVALHSPAECVNPRTSPHEREQIRKKAKSVLLFVLPHSSYLTRLTTSKRPEH